MKWKNLFSAVKSLTAPEVKKLIDSHPAGDYQILDVRQPKEYQAAHLPGAIFIPLATLPDRVGDLAKDKPTVAYCAVGGRSRAASQFLAGQGFTDIYNMTGGIKAWQGLTATGPEDAGMEHIVGDEDFADGFALAYAMEDGLQQFYNILAAESTATAMEELFHRLAGFEENHKNRLQQEYAAEQKEGDLDRAMTGKSGAETDIMEGGGTISAYLETVRPRLTGPHDILDLAMALESQALDLYGRLAQKSTVDKTKNLFLWLADEEKTHLKYLAREFEKRI
jgi:rhodanese-related sulfurtransferase/rubrerythrin